MWTNCIAEMTTLGYRCVNVALPGYEMSPSASKFAPQSFDKMCERLRETISASQAENPVLIAHDWGAIIAYLYLQKHPKDFSKVVCLDIGLAPKSLLRAVMVLTYQGALVLGYFFGRGLGDFWVRFISRFVMRQPRYPNQSRVVARHAWLYWQAWKEAGTFGPLFYYYRNRIASWNPDPEVPFLFLYGKDMFRLGQFHSLEWRQAVQAAHPDNKALGISGGHWFLLEQPGLFLENLMSFLEGESPEAH